MNHRILLENRIKELGVKVKELKEDIKVEEDSGMIKLLNQELNINERVLKEFKDYREESLKVDRHID